MEFNSPSTVYLVCLNIYNTVQLKIETSIHCVGGAPSRRPESRRRGGGAPMPKNRRRRRDKKVGGGGAARPVQGSTVRYAEGL